MGSILTGSQDASATYTADLSAALRAPVVYDPSWSQRSDRWVWEKIRRDANAAHAISYRCRLAAGLEYCLEPASDSDTDKEAAAICEELLGGIENFADARAELASAIFRGSAYAFIEGARETRLVNGREGFWWVPRRLVDFDRRRFSRRRQPDGSIAWELYSLEREAWEPLGDRFAWFVRHHFDLTEASLGYGRGLLDSVFVASDLKARTLQLYADAGARAATGFVTLAIESMRGPDGRPNRGDGTSAEDVADAWAEAIRKHRGNNTLVHDKRDEVKVHSGFAESYNLLQSLITYCDNQVTKAVLGSILPTSGDGGGSFAMAVVQGNATESLVQSDRKRLGEDLTRDLIGQVWRLNWAQIVDAGLGRARPPSLRITQRAREEPKEDAQIISAALAAGIPLRSDEVYKRLGFTPPGPDDDVIRGGASGAPAGGFEDLLGLPTMASNG